MDEIEYIKRKLEKHIRLYRIEFLSLSEVVYSILFRLTDVEESDRRLEVFEQLPEDLRTAVVDRLQELEKEDYRWRPFLIGPGLDDAGLQQLSRRLRSLHDQLR